VYDHRSGYCRITPFGVIEPPFPDCLDSRLIQRLVVAAAVYGDGLAIAFGRTRCLTCFEFCEFDDCAVDSTDEGADSLSSAIPSVFGGFACLGFSGVFFDLGGSTGLGGAGGAVTALRPGAETNDTAIINGCAIVTGSFGCNNHWAAQMCNSITRTSSKLPIERGFSSPVKTSNKVRFLRTTDGGVVPPRSGKLCPIKPCSWLFNKYMENMPSLICTNVRCCLLLFRITAAQPAALYYYLVSQGNAGANGSLKIVEADSTKACHEFL
jgi:hypothetical protein